MFFSNGKFMMTIKEFTPELADKPVCGADILAELGALSTLFH
jgi:hypothetical protein